MASKKQLPLILGLLLIFTLPAFADGTAGYGESWHLRFGLSLLLPEAEIVDFDFNGPGIITDSDNSTGLGVSLEHRLNRRWGFEVGLFMADSEADFRADILGPIIIGGVVVDLETEFRFTALTAGFNLHLTPDSPVDLYLGPLVMYSRYDDVFLKTRVDGQTFDDRLGSDDYLAAGGQIGLDIPFGNRAWGLNLAAHYLRTRLQLDDVGDGDSRVNYDPLVLHAGLGYRF